MVHIVGINDLVNAKRQLDDRNVAYVCGAFSFYSMENNVLKFHTI